MKWHKNLYEGLKEAYISVARDNEAVDRVLQGLFRRRPEWGKRDRNFIKHHFFQLIRRKNLWEALAEKLFGSLSPERVVDAYVLAADDTQLPAFLPYNEQKRKEAVRWRQALENIPHLAAGWPEWLYAKGEETWKDDWPALPALLNEENFPAVRVNTLKSNREEVAEILRRAGMTEFSFPENYPDAILLHKNYRLTALPAYREGLFEIQDLGSQEVGIFSGVRPGMKVVDACAGAGGKTLHLAALMKNKGELYAFDIYPSKIRELKKRARRAGVKNLKKASLADPEEIKSLENQADVVLIDAPCSGSGTYRRNPHLKWKFEPGAFEKIIRTQRHVLDEYARMVKPGGTLIYATCSVLGDENRRQVEDFLNRHKDFTFVEEKHVWPGPGRDGFYMAKLKRK